MKFVDLLFQECMELKYSNLFGCLLHEICLVSYFRNECNTVVYGP